MTTVVDSPSAAIEVEVWAIRSAEFGSFVEGISAPLGIGKIELEDGAIIPGFVCESYATEGALDITGFGGWRAYLAGTASMAQHTVGYPTQPG